MWSNVCQESKKQKSAFLFNSFKTLIPTFGSVLLKGIKFQILLTSTFNIFPIESEITDLRNDPLLAFVSQEYIVPPKSAQWRNIARVLAPDPVSSKTSCFFFFFLNEFSTLKIAIHSLSGIPLAHLGNNLLTKIRKSSDSLDPFNILPEFL